MNKIRLLLLGALSVAVTAQAALNVGESAPQFEARASLDGSAFDYSLAEALEEGAVVVYFYPSAYTRGCNIQAHEFSVNMDEFKAAGASSTTVRAASEPAIGISAAASSTTAAHPALNNPRLKTAFFIDLTL